jgi:hypothetical protein
MGLPKQSFQITCLPQYSTNICFREQGHVILLQESVIFVRQERWTLSPLRAGRPGTSGRLKRPYNCQVTCVLGLIRWRRPKFQDVSYAQPSSKALSAQKRRQGQPAATPLKPLGSRDVPKIMRLREFKAFFSRDVLVSRTSREVSDAPGGAGCPPEKKGRRLLVAFLHYY